jgi:uroporphyrinogen III methyltransferase/synthase
MNKKPLAGRRILITRARDQAAAFAENLRNFGAEIIEFPTIEIVPPPRWDQVDRAIDQLESYNWLIFTSANGVNFFWQRLREKGRGHPFLLSTKICAIGPATSYALLEKGIRVDYTPKEFVAESILKGFEKSAVKGMKILLARASEARDVLPKGLKKMGAKVDVVEAYRTLRPKGGGQKLKQLLARGKVDGITFTSSSTVNHFAELLEKGDLQKLLTGIVIACIGPITTRTAKRWGMRVHVQPKQYTVPALAQALSDYFARKHPGTRKARISNPNPATIKKQ